MGSIGVIFFLTSVPDGIAFEWLVVGLDLRVLVGFHIIECTVRIVIQSCCWFLNYQLWNLFSFSCSQIVFCLWLAAFLSVILVLVLNPWWHELAGRPFSEPALPFIRWINPENIYIKKKKKNLHTNHSINSSFPLARESFKLLEGGLRNKACDVTWAIDLSLYHWISIGIYIVLGQVPNLENYQEQNILSGHLSA